MGYRPQTCLFDLLHRAHTPSFRARAVRRRFSSSKGVRILGRFPNVVMVAFTWPLSSSSDIRRRVWGVLLPVVTSSKAGRFLESRPSGFPLGLYKMISSEPAEFLAAPLRFGGRGDGLAPVLCSNLISVLAIEGRRDVSRSKAELGLILCRTSVDGETPSRVGTGLSGPGLESELDPVWYPLERA